MSGITAVILAGGRATRMGGIDKGLLLLDNKPLIEYVLQVLEPGFETILINANRNLDVYQRYGKTLVKDESSDFQGPLSGILAAMHSMQSDWLFVVPCDSPLITSSVINRILEQLPGSEPLSQQRPVVAHDGERLQPMFCLLHKSLAASIADYLASGERKTQRWFEHNNPMLVDFSDQAVRFTNINSEPDLKLAETWIKTHEDEY